MIFQLPGIGILALLAIRAKLPGYATLFCLLAVTSRSTAYYSPEHIFYHLGMLAAFRAALRLDAVGGRDASVAASTGSVG
jgi:hypothetical protein